MTENYQRSNFDTKGTLHSTSGSGKSVSNGSVSRGRSNTIAVVLDNQTIVDSLGSTSSSHGIPRMKTTDEMNVHHTPISLEHIIHNTHVDADGREHTTPAVARFRNLREYDGSSKSNSGKDYDIAAYHDSNSNSNHSSGKHKIHKSSSSFRNLSMSRTKSLPMNHHSLAAKLLALENTRLLNDTIVLETIDGSGGSGGNGISAELSGKLSYKMKGHYSQPMGLSELGSLSIASFGSVLSSSAVSSMPSSSVSLSRITSPTAFLDSITRKDT